MQRAIVSASFGEEIGGAFDLGSAVAHNAARVSGCGPVLVQTDSPRWSYAAAFPLRTDALAQYTGRNPLVIRVNASIRRGCIGALFVADDLETILSTVDERSHVDEYGTMDLLLNQGPNSGWLILRNNAIGGDPSECEVSSIQVFVARRTVAEASGLASVLTAAGEIDLTKLAAVVDRERTEGDRGHGTFETLRRKWSEVPAGLNPRCRTAEIADLTDVELQRSCTRIQEETTTGPGFAVHGWYHSPKMTASAEQLDVVTVEQLSVRMGFLETLDYPSVSRHKLLTHRKMEVDDSPILRYLYRNFRPRRHLEFGTWQGTGALYCLEECAATVWTISLPGGEKMEDGTPAYESDSGLSIGGHYREHAFGNRVCQIYSDSRDWDISNYPRGFFDSTFIDGGHDPDTVRSDTAKALALLRPGALCVWHDFCPDPEVLRRKPPSLGVVDGLIRDWDLIRSRMRDIFWIEPSLILTGILDEASD
jgi:predicted O-methyltransferase YrrM